MQFSLILSFPQQSLGTDLIPVLVRALSPGGSTFFLKVTWVKMFRLCRGGFQLLCLGGCFLPLSTENIFPCGLVGALLYKICLLSRVVERVFLLFLVNIFWLSSAVASRFNHSVLDLLGNHRYRSIHTALCASVHRVLFCSYHVTVCLLALLGTVLLLRLEAFQLVPFSQVHTLGLYYWLNVFLPYDKNNRYTHTQSSHTLTRMHMLTHSMPTFKHKLFYKSPWSGTTPWIFYTTGYEHKETPLCSVGMVTAHVEVKTISLLCITWCG